MRLHTASRVNPRKGPGIPAVYESFSGPGEEAKQVPRQKTVFSHRSRRQVPGQPVDENPHPDGAVKVETKARHGGDTSCQDVPAPAVAIPEFPVRLIQVRPSGSETRV